MYGAVPDWGDFDQLPFTIYKDMSLFFKPAARPDSEQPIHQTIGILCLTIPKLGGNDDLGNKNLCAAGL